MQPLDPDTRHVLRLIVDHAGEEGISSAELVELAAKAGDPRLAFVCNNSSAIAMRVIPLERRGLVISTTPATRKQMFATQRGLDVAAGGMQCDSCGCTDNDACEDGCGWARADLCSNCAPVTA